MRPQRTAGRAVPRPLLAIVVLAIVGTVLYRLSRPAPEPAGLVRASGTVEATEVDVAPRVAGRLLRLAVEEGDTVQRGQLLARLDGAEIEARVGQARAALAVAEARLADLVAGTRAEQIRAADADYRRSVVTAQGQAEVRDTLRDAYDRSGELKAALANAEAAHRAAARELDAARARLELVRAGPRAEDLDRLRAQVAQARATAAGAEDDARRYEALAAEGAISAQQLARARATLDAARAAVEAADAALRAGVAGSRPEEVREAEARVQQAEARLEGARQALAAQRQVSRDRLEALQRLQTASTAARAARLQSDAARAQLDLALAGATRDAIGAASAQARQARAALQEALAQRAHLNVFAPCDGVVTVKYREPGEVVAAGAPIVRVADLGRVWLRVYAPLPTLGRIRVGQTAEIVAEAVPGRRVQGRVASIREEPEFTPKNVQTPEERVKLVYAVRIEAANPDHALKPGMPADALIRTSSREAAARGARQPAPRT